MKKLIVALCFACAVTLAARAQDKPAEGKQESKKPAPTAEQKAARKALMEKYDANKDGKLDKEEKAKITPEELEKAGMHATKKEHKKNK